ncbi:MAG TPA: hypothetical protein VFN97_21590 [Actinospica sp.]|nr:hypothetical protein [Actinospica sp.]
MKRRTADPLAPLLPVARLAAVGLVAAGATLAAVLSLDGHASVDPAAGMAKLVAIPRYPYQDAKHTTNSATITNQAEIARVAAIINNLPPAPTGIFNCPADFGGGLALDFESASGAMVEQATMRATGCGGTTITINGKQSDRASDRETLAEIQHILGTDWQLIPTFAGGLPG